MLRSNLLKAIVTLGCCFPLVGMIPSVSHGKDLLMVTLEHPPHSFSADGEVTGASTEVLQRIFTQMGYTPIFRLLPWRRAQAMVENGDAAGIYTYTQTPQRLATAYYSHPVSFTRDVLFKRKHDTITWKTFADLMSYRVGASDEYNYPEKFLAAAQRGTFSLSYVYGVQANFLNLKRLQLQRIDLFICNPDVCGFIIKTHLPEFDNLDYIDVPVAPVRSFHVGFSKKWPGSRQIRDEFNLLFDVMLANGELKKIYDRYGMKPDYGQLGSKGAAFLGENAN